MTLPALSVNQVVTASDADNVAKDLGNVYWQGDKAYRLVTAAANISSAAKKILVTAMSDGVPTWNVNTSTTAGDSHVAGIVPADIDTISDTAGRLDSGDYFLIQVHGPATGISATSGIADNGLIGASTTAGHIDDASVNAGVGAAGTATQASTAASQDITVFLKGLL